MFWERTFCKKIRNKKVILLKTTSGFRPRETVDRFRRIAPRCDAFSTKFRGGCCRPFKTDYQRIQTKGTWDARRRLPPPYAMPTCKYDNSDNVVNRRTRKNNLSPTRGCGWVCVAVNRPENRRRTLLSPSSPQSAGAKRDNGDDSRFLKLIGILLKIYN